MESPATTDPVLADLARAAAHGDRATALAAFERARADGRALDAVRSIAATRPRGPAWWVLCRCLESLPLGPELDAAVETARPLLEPWYDGLRRAPRAWWERLEDGEDDPRFSLVRAITLGWEHARRVPLATLHERPALASVRSVDATYADADVVALLRDCEHLAGVTVLHFGGGGEAGVRSLLGSRLFANLVVLDLGVSHLEPDAVFALAGAEGLVRLEALSLLGATFDRAAFAALLNARFLPQLRWLDLSLTHKLGLPELRALVASTALGRLEHLGLGDVQLGARAGEVLASATGLGALRSLDLKHTGLGDAGVASLARGRTFEHLASLELECNKLTDAALESLAASTALPRLRTLGLSSNKIREAGLARLAASPLLAGLRSLDLSFNRVNAAGLAALAGSPRAASLRRLDLACNHPIGRKGGAALGASARFRALRSLDLGLCGVGDEAAIALATAPWTASLRTLDLRLDRITARGAEALARSPHLRRLRALDLSENPLGDRGAAAIARSNVLAPRGASLVLERCDIGDEGARALAASPAIARLRSLDLSRNRIGPEGAAALGTEGALAAVARLRTRGNPLEARGRAALSRWRRSARPWRRLFRFEVRRVLVGR